MTHFLQEDILFSTNQVQVGQKDSHSDTECNLSLNELGEVDDSSEEEQEYGHLDSTAEGAGHLIKLNKV